MQEKVAFFTIVCFLLYGVFLSATASAEASPPLMLAKQYNENIDIEKYWISEKLDGIRARWDGEKLISKNGYEFSVPNWFVNGFPNVVMEGELWIARNAYEETSSITSTQGEDARWSKIKLMLFDLPDHKGTFTQRLERMQQLVKSVDSPYLSVIRQYRVGSREALLAQLQSVVEAGGEGLMLHHESSLYINGRSENLLKLKKFYDAEATVIAYKSGKGQFKNLLGSIKVRNDQAKEFYIGSGFSIQQRENPPALLSRVTYKYYGVTKNGLPRFPVFLRERNEK